MKENAHREELVSLVKCLNDKIGALQYVFGRLQALTDLLSETEDFKYSISCVASLYSALLSPVNDSINDIDGCCSEFKELIDKDESEL
ncbi:MAG: hypothetical protein D3906_13565 [Candidatus Electrothrix sp. AUS1_2]|nr:hypothetical protein [Candidatus Electrothrix sp. AUS1_2]